MEFNVGDRVNVDGLNGTVICISVGDLLGIQFDDDDYAGHRCLGVTLRAGSPSIKKNCWWVRPESATHGEAIVNDNR